MRWSKLKRNVESFLADSVKGRVGLHSTCYRTMHDHDGRAWITLDGHEIINMTHVWQWLREVKNRAAALAGVSNSAEWEEYRDFEGQAEEELREKSFFTQYDLGKAMHDYQSMSMEEVLVSGDQIVRAIGMLDRRLGKRRLARVDIAGEHPLVKTTYLFRLQAEGMIDSSDPNRKGNKK